MLKVGINLELYKDMAITIINEKYELVKNSKINLINQLSEDSSKGSINICLFGTGLVGKGFYNDLGTMGVKIKYFCDNDSKKWGTDIIGGVVCLSPQQLEEKYKQENILVVVSVGAINEVYLQLEEMGISNIIKHPFDLFAEPQNNWMKVGKEELIDGVKKLFDILEDEESKRIAFYKVSAWFKLSDELKGLNYGDIFTKDEYVPADIMCLQGNEVMVDCGSYTGDTLAYFMSEIGYNSFKKYICFELSKFNFKELKMRVDSFEANIQKRIVLNNKGVSDTDAKIKYMGEISGTHISELGETEGEVIYLDKALKNEKVTYLKMDIEGSEISAIKGAKQLLQQNKPKCAICVYHKATDLWQIPILLKELVPDYKLYFRHHQTAQTDTVCYAVI